MKNKIKNWLFLLIVLVIAGACQNDFLERAPLDKLSDESYFNTSGDLETYVNGLYSQFRRYYFNAGAGSEHNARLDANSDIMIVSKDITSSLNQVGASGLAPVNSSAWNNTYDRIRQVNYFLMHTDKVTRDDIANQYIGEGFFFRAWNYFNFMADYGDVPYITEPLNVDSEDLYRTRDSRYDVAKYIIQDLDSAITYLSWKGVGTAKAGRINKEAAIVLKARVALFEGTWEKYHAQNNTKFAVSGKDGSDLLQMVEPAILQLIAHQGTNISKIGGSFNEPYNQIFSQEHAENTPGVYLYRVYDASLLTVSHNFYDKIVDNGASICKRLVDLYLDKNGLPQEKSTLSFSNLNEYGQNLDPRFRQTIWTPDRGPMTLITGRTAQSCFALRYPIIRKGFTEYITSTGIRTWKGAIFNEARYRMGEVDDVLIRYAEGLLALAEAKAALGTISQADLDKTVNVLRGRVGMNPMLLSDVNAWSVNYKAEEGFDPAASNIVNEIRRERTIELALEGFRLDDLKRWAVFDKVINGYKPKGVKAQEFIDYYNNAANLTADGWTGTANMTLTLGTNIGVDSEGYLNPYYESTQFQDSGEGFYINKDRDYLSAVPTSQIQLYKEFGVTLTQNPGWN
ncbi:MAG: RagB/SusD family nutrient uptake outer membrane protein [Draconibacterium sp.]